LSIRPRDPRPVEQDGLCGRPGEVAAPAAAVRPIFSSAGSVDGALDLSRRCVVGCDAAFRRGEFQVEAVAAGHPPAC